MLPAGETDAFKTRRSKMIKGFRAAFTAVVLLALVTPSHAWMGGGGKEKTPEEKLRQAQKEAFEIGWEFARDRRLVSPAQCRGQDARKRFRENELHWGRYADKIHDRFEDGCKREIRNTFGEKGPAKK